MPEFGAGCCGRLWKRKLLVPREFGDWKSVPRGTPVEKLRDSRNRRRGIWHGKQKERLPAGWSSELVTPARQGLRFSCSGIAITGRGRNSGSQSPGHPGSWLPLNNVSCRAGSGIPPEEGFGYFGLLALRQTKHALAPQTLLVG